MLLGDRGAYIALEQFVVGRLCLERNGAVWEVSIGTKLMPLENISVKKDCQEVCSWRHVETCRLRVLF